MAEQKLADANQQAEPTNRERDHARRDVSATRDALSSYDILDRWNYHPERVRDAESRVDALDTWKQWAQGHPVDHDELADTVEVLTNGPETEIEWTRALASVVWRWADENRIEIRPDRMQGIEAPDLGIEIDF